MVGERKFHVSESVNLNIEQRFWRLVDKTDGCWNWKANLVRGYGQFTVRGRKKSLAHRFSYELLRGVIPQGFTLDHLCRNRRCVNPEHLEIVTRGENVLRGETRAAKNKAKTHCVRGHLLAGDNLYTQPSDPSKRICKRCKSEHGHDTRKYQRCIAKLFAGRSQKQG